MLRLPAALLEDISLRTGQLGALAQTCTTMHALLRSPEVQLRFYLAAQRRRCRTSCSSSSSGGSGRTSCSSGSCTSGSCCVCSARPGSGQRQAATGTAAAAGCCACSCGAGDAATAAAAQLEGGDDSAFGPDTVYGLLACKARAADAPSSMRLLQLLLACSNMVQLVPQPAQEAVQRMVAEGDPGAAPRAARLLLSVLPYAEHCLLPFCAGSGHLQLVRLLLPLSHAPAPLHRALHYVKTSAFLAAAAGGQCTVLSELLSCGATSWACQLPGTSITQSALDLAALGGHIPAMQLLGHYVRNPSPLFLTAAADSGNGSAMQWALQSWFGQFNAVTAYSRAHMLQLHDALRVSCQRGHVSAVRQLLAALDRTQSLDCAVVALGYASSTCNTEAIRAVLDSPQLAAQLARGGPKLTSKLAQALASCLRIAIMRHNRPTLDLLLQALTSDSSSPAAAARPLLESQMPSIFDQAASAGNTTALQLLLLALPEHYAALAASALEAALAEGHADMAAMIKTLLLMQGSDQAAAAAALSPEGNPGLARASLHGAYKAACVRGDVPALQSLLQAGPAGPDDNVQLLLLRLAAGAGREAAVRLLLGEFGGAGPRLEANLRAVCRGAVHAGQLALLQSLAADSPSPLLSHISDQPEALAEYLRAALLCGQVDVAAWLVLLAEEKQQLDLVRHTLISLLATSRWELLNAGRGISAQDIVFELFRLLASQASSRRQQSLPQAHPTALPAAAAAGAAPAAPDAPAAAAGDAAGSSSSAAAVGPAAAAVPSRAGQAGRAALTAAPPAAGEPAAAAQGGGPAAPAPAAAPAATAAAGQPGAGAAGSTTSSLGRQLLQPPLLGLLLHATQGNPWLLLDVGEILHAFGLHQHPAQQLAAAAAAPAAEARAEQQASQAARDGASAASASAAAGAQGGAAGGPGSVSPSSEGLTTSASQRSSSSTMTASSSSTSSASGAAGANTKQAPGSRRAAPPGATGAGGAAAGDLMLASSLESGSNGSEEYPHAAAGTWLGDLMADAGGCCGGGAMHDGPAAPGSAIDQLLLQPQAQQRRPSQCYFLSPPGSRPLLREQQQQQQQQQAAAELAAAAGGSWQQLTGQVAQLAVSPPSPCHVASDQLRQQPEQQQQQQPSQRRHLQRHSMDTPYRPRRDSSPTPRARGAAAEARRLRPIASQPHTQQQQQSSPVHPYMQQLRRLQAQKQQEQGGELGGRAGAAAPPAGDGDGGDDRTGAV